MNKPRQKWNGGNVAVVVNGKIVDLRSNWSCDCGPHTEQIYDEVPLLCFEHKRHMPCRSNNHRWTDPWNPEWVMPII